MVLINNLGQFLPPSSSTRLEYRYAMINLRRLSGTTQIPAWPDVSDSPYRETNLVELIVTIPTPAVMWPQRNGCDTVYLFCGGHTSSECMSSQIQYLTKDSITYRDMLWPVSRIIPSLMVRGPCMPVGYLVIWSRTSCRLTASGKAFVVAALPFSQIVFRRRATVASLNETC